MEQIIKIFVSGCGQRMCIHAQSCPVLCDPMDCSPPGSSVHGILQARIPEWAAMPSSRGSSQPRDQTQVSCTGKWIFYHWTTWKPGCCYSHKELQNAYFKHVSMNPWSCHSLSRTSDSSGYQEVIGKLEHLFCASLQSLLIWFTELRTVKKQTKKCCS